MDCSRCQVADRHLSVNGCLDYLTSKLEFYKMLYDEFEDESAEKHIEITKNQIKKLYENYSEEISQEISTLCFSTKNI